MMSRAIQRHKLPAVDVRRPHRRQAIRRELIADVPGIARRVAAIIPWQSKNIKRLKSALPQADVAVRNFGMSAADLQKKLGIRPGGPRRLLAVTDAANTRLMLELEG